MMKMKQLLDMKKGVAARGSEIFSSARLPQVENAKASSANLITAAENDDATKRRGMINQMNYLCCSFLI